MGDVITPALAKLVRRDDLSATEIEGVASHILSGAASDTEIAGFIVALRTKGETVEELGALDGVQLPSQGTFGRCGQAGVGFAGLILPAPFSQRPVVGKAGGTCSADQISDLDVIRIKSNLVGDQHCGATTLSRIASKALRKSP